MHISSVTLSLTFSGLATYRAQNSINAFHFVLVKNDFCFYLFILEFDIYNNVNVNENLILSFS